MRFPRHAKIFCGQLDAAPFAGVFFLVLLFLLLNSSLVFTPGLKVQLELPTAGRLPGTGGPAVVVAVDRAGKLYYENQVIEEPELLTKLRAQAEKSRRAKSGLTLVVQADKLVAYAVVVRLAELAREAGINEVLQATRPPFQPAP